MSERIPVLKADRQLERLSDLMPQADEAARQLYAEVAPGVVKVATDRGSGSGFFVDGQGRVVTNAHVVQDVTEIKVVDHDGGKYRARLEKLDDINDLAVLKLEGAASTSSRALSLGASKALSPDQPVWALGHPLGLTPTYISPGYFRSRDLELNVLTQRDPNFQTDLAKKKQELTPAEAADVDAFLARPLLHGKVHLEGGNSGGPLVDRSGKVVGVSDWIDPRDHSRSYFIPVDKVEELLAQKDSKFEISHAYAAQPWANLYQWQWKNLPTVAAVETGIAGLTAAGAARLAVRFPRFGTFGAVSLGVLGLTELASDGADFLSHHSDRDRLKFGIASASDLLTVAGAVARFIPAARPYSLAAVGIGLAGRIGSDFIPNRLVITDIRRTNGAPHPPFDPEKI
ncbi:MAG TPA: S1C family serine protease [Candidatus Obscuribacterales bacterium]